MVQCRPLGAKRPMIVRPMGESFLLERRSLLNHAIRAGLSEDIPLAEAADFHRTLGPQRSLSAAIAAASEARVTLCQPRSGVGSIEGQIALLKTLTESGADVLSLTVDSHTRQHEFAKARALFSGSGAGALNGFPVVAAGVDGCRQVVRSASKPLEARHGHPDARLLAEVALAGGCSAFEGGGITYCLPYSKDYPLTRALSNWRYVDRLCAAYTDLGVSIHRESFGALTGLLVPPAIALACGLLELVLAANEGVASFSIGYAQGGSVVQDAAALFAAQELGEELCAELGLRVDVSTVFYQWMGPFPPDPPTANAVISWASVVAGIARPARMITKSTMEAWRVPEADANASGVALSKALLSMAGRSDFVDGGAVAEEQYWIKREVRSLIDPVLDGRGTLDGNIARAFEEGKLDVPFAPSRMARGLVWPGRDARGAIRFRDCGLLALDGATRRHNEECFGRGTRGRKRLPEYVADPQPSALGWSRSGGLPALAEGIGGGQ